MTENINGVEYEFVPAEQYINCFKERGLTIPPFLIFMPYVVRDGVEGYLFPVKPQPKETKVIE